MLGFADDQLATLRRLFRIPHGLLLVTGPTGSGKTTTLNAMIREIVSDTLKIVTIEDPVEYLIEGVNQIQTNEQIKLGFDTILRRVLRQDPNVIMVGEIRDGTTAELAVRAALTGHLVLSTLHTNDAVSVIPRLVNMGVERYLIASVLRGAVAQRLVRKACPACAKTRPVTGPEERLFRSYGVAATTIPESAGCSECVGTGYRGRTVIAEVFASDPDIEEAIMAGSRAGELEHLLAEKGCRSLIKDGLEKVAAGTTTLAEIEREIAIEEGAS
jgi:general secretion pathway protein E/type IV pilus assembly protein PilB